MNPNGRPGVDLAAGQKSCSGSSVQQQKRRCCSFDAAVSPSACRNRLRRRRPPLQRLPVCPCAASRSLPSLRRCRVDSGACLARATSPKHKTLHGSARLPLPAFSALSALPATQQASSSSLRGFRAIFLTGRPSDATTVQRRWQPTDARWPKELVAGADAELRRTLDERSSRQWQTRRRARTHDSNDGPSGV